MILALFNWLIHASWWQLLLVGVVAMHIIGPLMRDY